MIVESPAKAKTIDKYLGGEFNVLASFGHVRDLPSSTLGVDEKADFEPKYVVVPKVKKNLALIKRSAKEAPEVYLATDLDREGEAIAWHIAEAVGLKDPKAKRIVFDEISREAIKEALKHPRGIDMHLVDAQQARRVIDRLVGYKLSPLLWEKVYKGLSAGRVQSVALRLVVEREREIEGFKPQEYWSVIAVLEKEKISFEARLVEENGKKIDKLDIPSQKEADRIVAQLEKGKYEVLDISFKVEKKHPSAPYTTSTLQQDAHHQLGFSAKQTMMLAQSLYESGYITYMRTDSVNISSTAVGKIRNYIAKRYGDKFLSTEPRVYKTKSRLAQEAHEAIRPVDVFKSPDKASGEFEPKAARLYELIWRRAVASQMKEAELDIVEVKIANQKYLFSARGQMIKFKGFLEIYPQKITEITLPSLSKGDTLALIELKKEQHFTEPPPRYSEATLIKALEERGIGRPSTYAPTVATIQDREYVIKKEGKLHPEKVGFVVSDLLVKNFSDVVDYGFTAQVEDELDQIAEGKIPWKKVVGNFYGPFSKNLEKKADSIEKQKVDEDLGENCPECGKKLVVRHSKTGKFIGCSGFPDCKFTKDLISPEHQEMMDRGEQAIDGKKCPKCGSDLKVVKGRYSPFIGCSGYPKCNYMEKIANKESVQSNQQPDQKPPVKG
ncbi:MAG: type I DNA topoisomerase [Candidatus Berkelbacteria bacterium]|nr:type I DNA topoisomerase [Candidatus Berkelbacteria bacterium]